MRFRTSIHILIDNFVNVYKLLLYRIITGIIFFSLGYVTLKLGLGVITSSTEMDQVLSLISEFFRALTSGDSVYLQGFQSIFTEALKALLEVVVAHIGSIVGSVIGLIVIYLLSRFFNGLALFTVGCAFNDRMQTYSRTKFSSAFFTGFGRAALYTVIYVPLAFLYDALTLLVSWFFFFYVLSFLVGHAFLSVLASLMLTVTAVICLQALKLTLASSWMPAVINGKGNCASLKASITHGKNFGSRFSSFLVAIYLIVILNVICAVFTFGSALLLTISMSFMLLLSIQFVHYYEDAGKRYFISFEQIKGDDHEDIIQK